MNDRKQCYYELGFNLLHPFIQVITISYCVEKIYSKNVTFRNVIKGINTDNWGCVSQAVIIKQELLQMTTLPYSRMHIHQFQKKALLTTCIVLLTLYIMQPQNHTIFYQFYYYMYPKRSIQCYHTRSETLPDISDSRPAIGRSIFFHETSCNSHLNGKITITARQACAVESAARLNPNFEVYLLFASPGVFKFDGSESDRFLQALMSYSNVHIKHIDYGRYTKNTPVESLYKKGKVEVSSYAQSHASDVLRYLTLYKYGGIYLDLDVIVIKPLESLPPNYAGSESSLNVAAGVLNFSPEGLGHDLAQRCLNDLSQNFRGYDWGYNGPGVITRLLKDICGVDTAKEMLNKKCQGFKVFPKEAFYPISWWDWKMYFDEESSQQVFNISRHSYAIHVWNKHSFNTKVEAKGNSAYVIFAQQFCPRVIGECEYFF